MQDVWDECAEELSLQLVPRLTTTKGYREGLDRGLGLARQSGFNSTFSSSAHDAFRESYRNGCLAALGLFQNKHPDQCPDVDPSATQRLKRLNRRLNDQILGSTSSAARKVTVNLTDTSDLEVAAETESLPLSLTGSVRLADDSESQTLRRDLRADVKVDHSTVEDVNGALVSLIGAFALPVTEVMAGDCMSQSSSSSTTTTTATGMQASTQFNSEHI